MNGPTPRKFLNFSATVRRVMLTNTPNEMIFKFMQICNH